MLALACMMAVVQKTGAQGYFSSASDFARLYVGEVEVPYQIAQWYDIPYYNGTTNVYRGRISYYGGVYDDVQLRFDLLKQLNLPSTVYNMLPYIISLIVLIIFSKNSAAPKAEGIPYDPGSR